MSMPHLACVRVRACVFQTKMLSKGNLLAEGKDTALTMNSSTPYFSTDTWDLAAPLAFKMIQKGIEKKLKSSCQEVLVTQHLLGSATAL